MKTVRLQSLERQRGIAMLATTLVVLVAMTVMTGIGARLALNNQRVASNAAHTDGAFQVADAGLDNALAYLNHNREYVASAGVNGWFHPSSAKQWVACDGSFTDLPCGDGDVNLYGSDWLFYGTVPNLQHVDADYSNPVYLLSQNIDDIPAEDPWLGCLNLSLGAILPTGFMGGVNSLINSVLGLLNILTNPLTLLHLQNVGLPTDLCLPLNFNGANTPPPPSSVNPTIRVVSIADNISDARGGSARLQQDLQTASLFAWDPMAAIMIDGAASLDGEIHVWGNPRPPSRPPFDWSVLDLNDVLGLSVTDMLDDMLNGVGGGLDPLLNLTAVDLAPLLNLTVPEVLALDINATFPLSIWSHNTTTLEPGPALTVQVPLLGSPSLTGTLAGPRTCLPPYSGNGTCTMFLSTTAGVKKLLGLATAKVQVKLPDIQDEHNLVSTITNLLDTSAPVDFPDDLFNHVFGIPSAESDTIEQQANALADCSDLHNQPGGLYWVSGDCSISGIVGSESEPLIVITEGDLNMASGSEFWGVMYLKGNGNRSVTGSAGGIRPIIQGSLLVEANLNATSNFNVVYNRDAIRRAGYGVGRFVRLPGGWSDELTGP